jgi:hypothetical protein
MNIPHHSGHVYRAEIKTDEAGIDYLKFWLDDGSPEWGWICCKCYGYDPTIQEGDKVMVLDSEMKRSSKDTAWYLEPTCVIRVVDERKVNQEIARQATCRR